MKPVRAIIVFCIPLLIAAACGCCSTDYLLKQKRINAYRRITVNDGTEVDVWVIKSRPAGDATTQASKGKATAILLHPMLTDKCWFLSLGERLAREGWDVVLPDLRAHGGSSGEHVTWGAKEKDDIKGVMDQLVKEGQVSPRIFAMGASLGGCVAIQYAAIDPRCKGVLALAPPTGLRGYIEASTWFLATKAWKDGRVIRHAKRGGYDPDDASALRAAGELTCPLVLVHGRLDTTVPFGQIKAIYDAAAGPKKMIRLWADHGGVQMWCNGRLIEQLDELVKMAAKQGPATD